MDKHFLGKISTKTCIEAPTNDKAKYKREEEEAQYISEKTKVEHETSSSHRTFSGRSPTTHGSGFSPRHLARRTISHLLDQG